MAEDNVQTKKTGTCCSFNFPDIPAPWLLFIEFAFTFGTTVVYFADIVTDIITLKMYYEREWYYAFGFSIAFIVLPSILLAVLEYQFLKKTYGRSVTWKTITIRTILNVPFQLTVVWYHCQLTYSFLKNWLDHIRGVEQPDGRIGTSTAQWYDPTTLERSRGASLSSLNELDYYHSAPTEELWEEGMSSPESPRREGLSQSTHCLAAVDEGASSKEKTSWWKRLTKEQWLSHLNKLKLSESMLESLPQLLLNLYLIVRHPNTASIQYVSAILSYLSLCGGSVRYDKTRKDNEADRWMVDKTLLHSRAFYTRLEWPQLLFISIYKGSFLAARILAFVYFTIYFSWYILVPILLHWGVLLVYLVYRWYPDFNKVTKQLRQADNKYRAYIFLSHDFLSVFLASLMGIFIHVRPYYHTFLDQPYCFMFWYYLAYVTENIVLFLLPGIIMSMNGFDVDLNLYQYYPLLATELILSIVGSIFCCTYYLAVHKMRPYTAHAYPTAAKALCCCCYHTHDDDDFDYWLPVRDDWTVCKQAETSELFFLTKAQLKSFHQTYNTVVRNDRLKGRAVECFIDDKCKIFYAPRSKMKKMTFKICNDATMRPSLRRLNDDKEKNHAAKGLSEDDAFLEERMKIARRHSRPSDSDSGSDSEKRQITKNSRVPAEDISNHDFGDHHPGTSGKNVELQPPKICQESSLASKGDSPDVHVVKPVRKPRVKSLRHALNPNIEVKPEDSVEELTKKPQEVEVSAGKQLIKVPVRLPRKIDNPGVMPKLVNQSEPVEITSVQSNQSKLGSTFPPASRELEKSSRSRRPKEVPTPRRIDDPAWSSSSRTRFQRALPEIDDSTYRVTKKPTSSNNFTRKVGFEDKSLPSVSEKRHCLPEGASHKAGEVASDDPDWMETWI